MNYSDAVSKLDVLNEVVKTLSSVQHFDGYSFVSTPLMYPNGGTVVVRVEKNINSFLVTDFGVGHDEADMINGSGFYPTIAKKIASESGVRFDQQSFFALDVDEGQLAGAITVIANCTHEAVMRVYDKVNEYKAQRSSDRVFERLTRVYEPKLIARDVAILGASNKQWQFDALVRKDQQEIIFQSVGSSHAAIYPSIVKFHDVSLNDNAPTRYAVIGPPKAYKDNLGLLSQSANVIELKADDDTYENILAA